ncbi:MAG: HU family DNA-binding protein, partial [Parachlamydiales bacterium]
RKQKIGRNPKNASVPIIIPARKAVKFTAGKFMKKEIETQGASLKNSSSGIAPDTGSSVNPPANM